MSVSVPTVAPPTDDPQRVAARALTATHPPLTPQQRDTIRAAARMATRRHGDT